MSLYNNIMVENGDMTEFYKKIDELINNVLPAKAGNKIPKEDIYTIIYTTNIFCV